MLGSLCLALVQSGEEFAQGENMRICRLVQDDILLLAGRYQSIAVLN